MKIFIFSSIFSIALILIILSVSFVTYQISWSQMDLTKTNFSAPITVADNGAHGAALTINPHSNEIYIAYIQTDGNITNLYFTKSADSGQTFTDPVQVNDKTGDVMFDGRVPPEIKVDDDGTIHILWVKNKEAPGFMYGFRTLQMSKSLDGGKTFSSAIPVENSNDVDSAKAFQTFDVSTNGTVYVGSLNSEVNILDNGTILRTDDENSKATFIRSLDGGKTFDPSITLDNTSCPCCNVHILAGSEQEVYVSWRKQFPLSPSDEIHENSESIRDMVVAYSKDGKSFEPPIKISKDRFITNQCVHVGAPMVLDSNGNLHVVWYTGKQDSPGIYYASSSNKGQNFSSPIPILNGEWVPPLRSAIAIDNKNTIWATWEDSFGLSANPEVWKFENTSAIIYAAKIINNTVYKIDMPINTENGRSPSIAAGNDIVAILWNGDDSIELAVTKTDL